MKVKIICIIVWIICGVSLYIKFRPILTPFHVIQAGDQEEIRTVEPIAGSGSCIAYRVRKITKKDGLVKETFFMKCDDGSVIKPPRPGSGKART